MWLPKPGVLLMLPGRLARCDAAGGNPQVSRPLAAEDRA
jgi:hypothetical protein